MKKVDIIIPAYNAHETIEQTLMSILMQSVLDDIRVTIIDDVSNKPYDEIIDKFKSVMDINLIVNDTNSGPGISRQNGIDNTNNPYIVFLDADDLLYDCYSIGKLLTKIEQEKCDYVDGKVVEEEDGKLNNPDYSTFDTHGKIYSRKCINKYNIKFPLTRVHEDNAYNRIFMTLDTALDRIPDPVYIYKRNVKDSIVNKYDNYFKETFDIFVSNMLYVIDSVEKNNAPKRRIGKQIAYMFVFIAAEYYYELSLYNEETVIKHLKDLYKKYLEYKDEIPARLLTDILYSLPVYKFRYDFYEFMNLLEKEYGE